VLPGWFPNLKCRIVIITDREYRRNGSLVPETLEIHAGSHDHSDRGARKDRKVGGFSGSVRSAAGDDVFLRESSRETAD
jgi:hypothetical protein